MPMKWLWVICPIGLVGTIGCQLPQHARTREYAQVVASVTRARHDVAPEYSAVSPVESAYVGPQPLEALVVKALESNPSIHAAHQRVIAAAARVPQAASLQDPMIGFNAWPIPAAAPQTLMGRGTIDMMLSQQVPWPGKLQAASSVAEQEANAARAELMDAQLEIEAEVKINYYRLLEIQESLAVIDQDQRFLRDLTELSQARYATGVSSQQQVLRLQAEISAVDAQRVELQQRRVEVQAALAQLLHVSPDTPIEAIDSSPAPTVPSDLQSLYERALSLRPQLHALLAELEGDRQRVRLAHLGYRPDVNVAVGWGAMTANRALAAEADGADTVATGLSMNVPIYRQRLEAAVREAEAQVAETARRYDQLKDQTQRDVKQLVNDAASQQQVLELLSESIIPKTEQAFQVSLEEYRVGRLEFADVLGAWRELLRSHLLKIQQASQLRQTLVSLERITGGSLFQGGEGW
jgi:outer membrane protein, heavy metal efflux system